MAQQYPPTRPLEVPPSLNPLPPPPVKLSLGLLLSSLTSDPPSWYFDQIVPGGWNITPPRSSVIGRLAFPLSLHLQKALITGFGLTMEKGDPSDSEATLQSINLWKHQAMAINSLLGYEKETLVSPTSILLDSKIRFKSEQALMDGIVPVKEVSDTPGGTSQSSYKFTGRKHSIIMATATSSGKSLVYQIPLLLSLESQPETRSLFLFPTKVGPFYWVQLSIFWFMDQRRTFLFNSVL